MRLRAFHSRFVVAFALAAVFGLSSPGVVAAEAETGLAPTASELFGGSARQLSLPSGAACNPAAVEAAKAQRQEVAARLSKLMLMDDGNGPGRALPNGYGYATNRNPIVHLERIQREAARGQRATR